MASKWIKSQYPGLRYREHEERSRGVGRSKRPLRYYMMTYKWKGKTLSESLGWEGDFIHDEEAAYKLFLDLKANRKNNTPPFTLKERIALNEAALEQDRLEVEKERKENLTFSEVFDDYLESVKINRRNEKGWKREEQLYRLHLAPVLKDLPLKNIKPLNLEKVRKNMMKAGSSARTIRYALAVVRQVFSYAIREKVYMGQNPALSGQVKRPQEDNRKVRYLTKLEAKRLLKELKKTSETIHDMALLSLYTGMRFSEVARLRWIDINTQFGTINITQTKSEKDRTAYVKPEVKMMLSGRKRGKPEELVFPPARGDRNKPRPLIGNTYYNAVNKLFNKDLTDRKSRVDFHTLRHTFASWLVEKGTDLYLIKELLGHSDIKITERYAHIGDNQLRQAVMKL